MMELDQVLTQAVKKAFAKYFPPDPLEDVYRFLEKLPKISPYGKVYVQRVRRRDTYMKQYFRERRAWRLCVYGQYSHFWNLLMPHARGTPKSKANVKRAQCKWHIGC